MEILVYLDDDDNQIEEYKVIPRVNYLIGPRVGYAMLHEVMVPIVEKAIGKWLFFWGDDAIMTTRHWDAEILKFSDDYVLNPYHNHGQGHLCVFPIVPKKWVATVGWSQNGANDTWWDVVGNLLARVKRPEIHIIHDRVDLTGNNNDITATDKDYDRATFFGLSMYATMGFQAGRIHEKFYANL